MNVFRLATIALIICHGAFYGIVQQANAQSAAVGYSNLFELDTRLLGSTTAIGHSNLFDLDTRVLGPVVSGIESERGNHLISGMPGSCKFEAVVAWNGTPGTARFRVNNEWRTASLEAIDTGRSRASVTVDSLGAIGSINQLVVEASNGAGRRATTKADVYFYPIHPMVGRWFGSSIAWNLDDDNRLDVSRDDSVGFWNFKSGVLKTAASYNDDIELRYDPYAGSFRGERSLGGGFGFELDTSDFALPVPIEEFIADSSVDGHGDLDVGLAGFGPPSVAGSLGINVSGRAGVGAPASILVDALVPPLSPAMATLRQIPVVKGIVNALILRAFLIGGWGIEGIWLDEEGTCWFGASSVSVNGTMGVEGQALIKAGDAEVGVTVKGTATPEVSVCPDLAFEGLTLRGYAGVFAKYLLFEHNIELEEGVGWETTFFDGAAQETLIYPQRMALEGVGESSEPRWEPLRDHILAHGESSRITAQSKTVSFMTQFAFETQSGSAGAIEEILLENINPLASPVLETATAAPAIHFVSLDTEKPWYGGTDIGEFEFDGVAWQMSLVTNDLLAEFSPATAAIGTGGLLGAWTRVGGDISGAEGPEDVLPELEIIVGVRDAGTGQWSAPVQLTDNAFLDHKPQPIVFGSRVGVVWIQNEGNEAPGTETSGDRLMFAEQTAGVWQAPVILWEQPKGVVAMDMAANSAGEAFVLLAVDEDGNSDTRNDHELYLLSTQAGAWQPATQLTNDGVEDSLPVLLAVQGNPMAIWKAGSVLKYSGLSPWNPTDIYLEQTLANEAPSLTGAELGSGAVIAYAVQTGNGIDVVAGFYDGMADAWSLPRQLTNDEAAESGITVAADGNDVLLAYVKTRILREDVDVDIGGTNYTIPDVPLPAQSDLAVLRHQPGGDLAIAAGSLRVDPEVPTPGSNVVLSVTVDNRGDFIADGIEVAFYQGDPEAGGVLIATTTLAEQLRGGSSAKAEAEWTTPNFDEPIEVYVVVDPDEVLEDRNRENNIGSQLFFTPVIQVVTGKSKPLSSTRISIQATIENSGAVAKEATSVVFRQGAVDGEEIGRITLSALEPGAQDTVEIIWDIVDRSFTSRFVTVFVVTENDSLAIATQVGASEIVWVDFNWTGAESGSEVAPVNTLAEGLALAASGGTIRIKPGESGEVLRIEQPVRLEAVGGGSRIGILSVAKEMSPAQTAEAGNAPSTVDGPFPPNTSAGGPASAAGASGERTGAEAWVLYR